MLPAEIFTQYAKQVYACFLLMCAVAVSDLKIGKELNYLFGLVETFISLVGHKIALFCRQKTK